MIYKREIFAEIPHISMIPGGVMPVLHCSQYDRSRPLQFILDDASASVYTVNVRGRRPDGATVTQADITPEDGVYTWNIDGTFAEIAGDCVCEVFYTPEDREIGSQNFILRVEPGPVREGDPTPWSNLRLTANGTYNARPYAEVTVDVPESGGGGITPTGTKTIAANGTYDVTNYASAVVNVPAGGNTALADFISRKTSGADVLDLMAYPIDTIRTNAFYGTRFSEIRIKANCIYTGGLAHMPVCEKVVIDGAAEVLAEAFQYSEYLEEVHFTGITAVPVLANSNAFSYTPIAGGSGKIFFPEALVAEAKEATNWNAYSDQIYGE